MNSDIKQASKKSALLLIDVQQGFDEPVWGKRNNLDAEDNIALLLKAWRKIDWPIIHIKHKSTNSQSPLHPNHSGNQFKAFAVPLETEKVFSKTVNSAFIGTDLEAYLHKHSIQHFYIAGLTTDHCVSTTTRMAANLGFDVSLVQDACATFDRTSKDGKYYTAEQIHELSLVSLENEFCELKTTSPIIKIIENEK